MNWLFLQYGKEKDRTLEFTLKKEIKPGRSGCFIATAAFGSYEEKHVCILREFRDRFLLTNPTGKLCVRFYYEHSPAMARFIASRPWARSLTRAALLPLIGASFLSLHNMPALLALIAFALLSTGYMMKKMKATKKR
ncbi:MAG: CFI-box-CTERM domain-containing protein [Vulcanimicrobiota bacterium]